jgi:hypothetical protein
MFVGIEVYDPALPYPECKDATQIFEFEDCVYPKQVVYANIRYDFMDVTFWRFLILFCGMLLVIWYTNIPDNTPRYVPGSSSLYDLQSPIEMLQVSRRLAQLKSSRTETIPSPTLPDIKEEDSSSGQGTPMKEQNMDSGGAQRGQVVIAVESFSRQDC